MTIEELDLFLSQHQNIEWKAITEEGEDYMLFRDPSLPFYADKMLKIHAPEFQDMTMEQFQDRLWSGRRVEHITRVTGYFGKVSHFNPGKLGELRDREKGDLDGRVAVGTGSNLRKEPEKVYMPKLHGNEFKDGQTEGGGIPDGGCTSWSAA